VTNILVIGWGVSILWGVENCPFPLTKPVAVNTGLALPRSLWWMCYHSPMTFVCEHLSDENCVFHATSNSSRLFHDLLSRSYLYHCVSSGITGRISLQTFCEKNRNDIPIFLVPTPSSKCASNIRALWLKWVQIARNSLLNWSSTGCLVSIFTVRVNSVFSVVCTLRTGNVPTQIFSNVRGPILRINTNNTQQCWCCYGDRYMEEKQTELETENK